MLRDVQPVELTLVIGDDIGTTNVIAELEQDEGDDNGD